MSRPAHISSPTLPCHTHSVRGPTDYAIEPDGLCKCELSDSMPNGECRRCHRLCKALVPL